MIFLIPPRGFAKSPFFWRYNVDIAMKYGLPDIRSIVDSNIKSCEFTVCFLKSFVLHYKPVRNRQSPHCNSGQKITGYVFGEATNIWALAIGYLSAIAIAKLFLAIISPCILQNGQPFSFLLLNMIIL